MQVMHVEESGESWWRRRRLQLQVLASPAIWCTSGIIAVDCQLYCNGSWDSHGRHRSEKLAPALKSHALLLLLSLWLSSPAFRDDWLADD